MCGLVFYLQHFTQRAAKGASEKVSRQLHTLDVRYDFVWMPVAVRTPGGGRGKRGGTKTQAATPTFPLQSPSNICSPGFSKSLRGIHIPFTGSEGGSPSIASLKRGVHCTPPSGPILSEPNLGRQKTS